MRALEDRRGDARPGEQGHRAALPVLPAAVDLLILVAVAVRTGQAGPGCLVPQAAEVLCPT
ncbi:MAG: hypothetical protein WBF34_32445 [Streptosporangiaceae bacterium]